MFDDSAAAVVILEQDKRAFFFHGDKVSSDSLFEIGSLTKPLFALLASRLVVDKVWSLEMPIADLLGQGFEHHSYTLLQLLTHRSGLPRLPKNLMPSNIDDPYVDFDSVDIKQALTLPIGKKGDFEYSNFGYGLLGWLMAKAWDKTQQEMVDNYLFNTLKMPHATLALSQLKKQQLSGRGYDGKPVANWYFDSLVGAGGALASPEDMANWISAYWQVEPSDSELFPMLKNSLTHLNNTMVYGFNKGLNSSYFHGGKTAGFTSMVVFDPSKQQGVIVMIAGPQDAGALAMRLFKQLQEKGQ